MRFLLSLKTFSTALFFLCASSGVVLGLNGWLDMSPPGADIQSLVFDSKDHNLVYAAAQGIFRSTDAGRNWEELESPTAPRFVRRLVVSPSESGVVYALNWNRGISKSTDKGDTWSFLGFPDKQVTNLAVDPVDGSRLYAIVEGILCRSTNRGAIWGSIAQGQGAVTAVANNPLDGTLLIGTVQGTHRSTDQGTTWTKTSDRRFDEFVFHPQKPDVIFGSLGNASVVKSTDRGQTWVHKTDTASGLPNFAVSPDSPYEMYVGAINFQGVLRSTDEGETWNPWNTGLSNLYVRVFAVRPGDPNTVLVGTAGAGVFRREEQAAAWQPSTEGMRRPLVSGIAYDQPGNRLYISTFGAGVFGSPLDDSFGWTSLNQGLPNLLLRDITVDPHNPSILYVAVLGEGLYRSIDAGQHWEAAKDGLGTNAVGFLAPDPKVPGRLLLTGGAPPNVNFLFESTNYGLSWTQLPVPLPGYTFTAPVIDSQSGRTYLIALDGLYRTQNPGASWEKIERGWLRRLIVEPGAPEHLFGTTEDKKIVRSTDGGKSWKTVSPAGTLLTQLTYVAGDPARLVALGASGLFFSVNSGETWTRLTGSPSADFPDDGAIQEIFAVPSNPPTLWAGFYVPGGLHGLDLSDSLFLPLLTADDGRRTGIALTNHGTATVRVSAQLYAPGIPGSGGPGMASLSIPSGGQKAGLTQELFGLEPSSGWVWANETKNLATGLVSVFSPDLSALDAIPAALGSFNKLIFPEVSASARIHLGNPNVTSADVILYLVNQAGALKGEPVRRILGPGGIQSAAMGDLFQDVDETDYVYVSSDVPLFGAEEIGQPGHYLAALSALDATGGSSRAYLPHFAWGPGLVSSITLVNLDTVPGLIGMRLLGTKSGAVAWVVRVPAGGKMVVEQSDLPGPLQGQTVSGYLEIESDEIRFTGSVRFTDPAALKFGTTLPVHQVPSRAWVLPHIVSTADYFTSLAILNPGTEPAHLTVQVARADGAVLVEGQKVLQPGERLANLLTELFPPLAGKELTSGSIRILSDRELNCIGLFGSNALTSLSAIPANVIP
ncbi:MAG: hypothetical protein EHM61_05405 [Acidobacteria bacterium]|nr:MAG: hypothetical protein EHM61_05405 [Acidobacteriota bacterium]